MTARRPPPGVEGLSGAERRELLKRLLAGPESAVRSYPASFAQQRLWLLSELEPCPAYHVYGAFELDEALEPEVLGRALEVVIRRHDILRTSFALQGGSLVQLVTDSIAAPLRVEDLSSSAAEEREREALRLVQAAVDEPFAKNRAPLFRVVLVQLGAGRQVLAVTLHHCIADLPSRDLFVGEVLEAYRAGLEGREPRLPPPGIQYAQHAVDERRRAREGGLVGLEDYWRERLGGFERGEPPVPLGPAGGERRAARCRIVLAAETTARLRELCRRSSVTPFMVVLAGWAALQARLAGEREVCIGTPVTTRGGGAAGGPLIGPSMDTLPLRLRVEGTPTFEDLLASTRAAVLADLEHRGLPFDRLVEALRVPRDPSRSPLFDVFFMLEDHRDLERSTRGLVGREWPVSRSFAALPLTVEWIDSGTSLAGALEYDAGRLQPGTVERLGARYERVLAAACADPALPVRHLPVSTESERRLQLVVWNDTALELPAEPTVVDLFGAQAARTPDRLAATCGGASVTYAELDRLASGVARLLARHGCGRGDLVGVGCERGLASLAALLGVMRSGAAYLPLDVRQPPSRSSSLLREAGARVCLADEATAARLGDWGGSTLPVACADGPLTADARPAAAGDDRAYVIYTSGSGGAPKGVEVSHRAMVSCLVSLRAALGLTGRERVFAHTTPSFDIAAVELFLPLIGGGQVALAAPGVDALGLAAEAMASGAEVVQATPSGWRLLLDTGWRGRGATTVLCGGEPLSAGLARRLLAEAASVWNLYGPTETTIWSTVHRVSPDDAAVPVGRPLGNTRVYVLDEDGELVPPGGRGELCIGGAGVALGYVGDPQLTARRFVPDPFCPGQRLYRTGDLARQRSDGVLELLGRRDDQVKIRGHRVEPGEVESCLAAHPALAAVAVVSQRDDEAGARLLAFYTARAEVSEAELRAFARARLPEVMVPALFVRSEALPTTPGGKLDRRALASLATAPGTPAEVTLPATPAELEVAGAFEAVLQRRGVGRHDNFFDLGGHSLLVPAVVARLTGRVRRSPTPMDLFRHPTVAALASALDGDLSPAEPAAMIAARARRRREAAESATRRAREGGRGRR